MPSAASPARLLRLARRRGIFITLEVAEAGIHAQAQSRLVRAGTFERVERYAVERFLYRLSRFPHAERFVLKGALLLLVSLGETIRPTRDAELLGFGELSKLSLARIVALVQEPLFALHWRLT